jgi:hypothetical protein
VSTMLILFRMISCDSHSQTFWHRSSVKSVQSVVCPFSSVIGLNAGPPTQRSADTLCRRHA